tara:strand:+ start:1608 stop:1895 length:288 start_codon:yes stop_codon:yes gene_type:complete
MYFTKIQKTITEFRNGEFPFWCIVSKYPKEDDHWRCWEEFETEEIRLLEQSIKKILSMTNDEFNEKYEGFDSVQLYFDYGQDGMEWKHISLIRKV